MPLQMCCISPYFVLQYYKWLIDVEVMIFVGFGKFLSITHKQAEASDIIDLLIQRLKLQKPSLSFVLTMIKGLQPVRKCLIQTLRIRCSKVTNYTMGAITMLEAV